MTEMNIAREAFGQYRPVIDSIEDALITKYKEEHMLKYYIVLLHMLKQYGTKNKVHVEGLGSYMPPTTFKHFLQLQEKTLVLWAEHDMLIFCSDLFVIYNGKPQSYAYKDRKKLSHGLYKLSLEIDDLNSDKVKQLTDAIYHQSKVLMYLRISRKIKYKSTPMTIKENSELISKIYRLMRGYLLRK